MQCPVCGEQNREGAQFCGECGASLVAEIACPACGASNPARRRFCDDCGQSLTAPSPGRSRAAGEGPGVGAVRVRIGLHTGEALRDAGDFFGKHVILAARIAAQAHGGQILASALLKDLTESSGEFHFDSGQAVALKGLHGTHRVYEVVWT